MAQGGYGGGSGYGVPPGGAPPGAPGGYGAPPGAQGGYGAPQGAGYGAPPGAPAAGWGGAQPAAAAPQAGWGAAPGAAAGGGNYEFNAAENQVIGTAGSRASLWGIVSLVGGGLMIVGGLIATIFGIVTIASARYSSTRMAGAATMGAGFVLLMMALQPLISGKLYLDAGKALKTVVDTQGNDITHVLEGLAKLRNAIRLEAIVAIVAVVLGLMFTLVAAAIIMAVLR